MRCALRAAQRCSLLLTTPPPSPTPPHNHYAALLASASPASAAVNFINVADGATVSSPLKVEMAVRGYQVLPASEGFIEGTGHFHVIVDRDAAADALEAGSVIAFDATHLHYGKGQTVADIELPPGRHTLTLQFADALHRSYGPEERRDVTVNVQ